MGTSTSDARAKGTSPGTGRLARFNLDDSVGVWISPHQMAFTGRRKNFTDFDFRGIADDSDYCEANGQENCSPPST
jgi:hypothetical protein